MDVYWWKTTRFAVFRYSMGADVYVPASRLFTQSFIHAQIKENIKALRHWPLWGEFTGDRRIPLTKGQCPFDDVIIIRAYLRSCRCGWLIWCHWSSIACLFLFSSATLGFWWQSSAWRFWRRTVSKFVWASYQIRKIAGSACEGNARNLFLTTTG